MMVLRTKRDQTEYWLVYLQQYQVHDGIDQWRRKDFLIGGARFETTHRVVSNLYNNYENLGGHMPPVPPRFLRLC